jgi:hypothetical protein
MFRNRRTPQLPSSAKGGIPYRFSPEDSKAIFSPSRTKLCHGDERKSSFFGHEHKSFSLNPSLGIRNIIGPIVGVIIPFFPKTGLLLIQYRRRKIRD